MNLRCFPTCNFAFSIRAAIFLRLGIQAMVVPCCSNYTLILILYRSFIGTLANKFLHCFFAVDRLLHRRNNFFLIFQINFSSFSSSIVLTACQMKLFLNFLQISIKLGLMNNSWRILTAYFRPKSFTPIIRTIYRFSGQIFEWLIWKFWRILPLIWFIDLFRTFIIWF